MGGGWGSRGRPRSGPTGARGEAGPRDRGPRDAAAEWHRRNPSSCISTRTPSRRTAPASWRNSMYTAPRKSSSTRCARASFRSLPFSVPAQQRLRRTEPTAGSQPLQTRSSWDHHLFRLVYSHSVRSRHSLWPRQDQAVQRLTGWASGSRVALKRRVRRSSALMVESAPVRAAAQRHLRKRLHSSATGPHRRGLSVTAQRIGMNPAHADVRGIPPQPRRRRDCRRRSRSSVHAENRGAQLPNRWSRRVRNRACVLGSTLDVFRRSRWWNKIGGPLES
jgi:hypothetical protein